MSHKKKSKLKEAIDKQSKNWEEADKGM